MYESAGVNELGYRECLRLLGSVSLGRLVYTAHALPAVRLVPFAVRESTVIMRVVDSDVAKAVRDAVVAFQADEISPELGGGWSVTVVGHATAVKDSLELAKLAGLRPWPWGIQKNGAYVRIAVEVVSGGRVTSEGG
ncbi:Pyridoxamine 5'-phosphate oxidase [Amycolatopsis xylanica]|uniref:Pyridoxamine 5'-phosphate oxidase n=1 Tax=Amycolatopsis xylanica TaxID=589385 RepID=A0A1H3QU10_9PSEU|nr:pyridoxamine 5'-phosphate oxidase family protein [Amycolatopsis xylanica]SDZ16820.1 Pyridoxamine 5'-phosphate oxidase [Amycolatopsis xylanica]